jgi:hypothetical protein
MIVPESPGCLVLYVKERIECPPELFTFQLVGGDRRNMPCNSSAPLHPLFKFRWCGRTAKSLSQRRRNLPLRNVRRREKTRRSSASVFQIKREHDYRKQQATRAVSSRRTMTG